jgi:hypothetical protein
MIGAKVYISSRHRKRLLARARVGKTSVTEQIRRAVDLYLEFPSDFEKEFLELLMRDVNASLDRSLACLDKTLARLKKTTRKLDAIAVRLA